MNNAKFNEELTCALENELRNLVSFESTLKSLKTFTLMGSF